MANNRDCPRTYPHGPHVWTPMEMGAHSTSFGANTNYHCGGNTPEEPPCTLDVQMAENHELEFHFDATGHVTKVTCSCGKSGTVEML